MGSSRSAKASAARSLVSVAGALLLWEGACRGGLVNPILLSPPSAVARALAVIVRADFFAADLFATLSAFAAALALSALIGASLGALMGASRAAYDLINPHVTALNAVPKIALMPVVTLWFGLGFPSALFLGTLMGSFPVIVSVGAGVRGLERDFTLLGRAFGASPAKLAWSVVLPGLAPHLAASLRVAANYVLVGVLIVELFASGRGLGYRMVVYSQNFQTASFFALLVLTMAFALLVSGLLRLLENRLNAWRPEPLP